MLDLTYRSAKSNILITVDFLINLFTVLQGLPELEKINLGLFTFSGDET